MPFSYVQLYILYIVKVDATPLLGVPVMLSMYNKQGNVQLPKANEKGAGGPLT